MHLDNSLNKLFEQVSRNSLNNLTYVVKKNICKTHESKDMSKIQQMPQKFKKRTPPIPWSHKFIALAERQKRVGLTQNSASSKRK